MQVGLDLSGAVELTARAVHPADLGGEQPELAADQHPADRAVGRPAASMISASPDARDTGLRDAGVWAGSSADRASWRLARASAPG